MENRFDGEICGFGLASGRRVVVGVWARSPMGSFADVMTEDADGRRTLLAPSQDIADFVAGVYAFDDVRVVDVRVERSSAALVVAAGPLHADVAIGRRGMLGWALRAVPRRLARSRRWTAITDPIARFAMRGVRTRGRTPGGTEYYAALDRHLVASASATWEGVDLGSLRPVAPPVRFGFGSTPTTPSIVAVSSIVVSGSEA